MTTTTTYTIHADRDEAEAALDELCDAAADEDDPCHGIEYGLAETPHTLVLDLDSVEEYTEGDEDDDDPRRELMTYVSAVVVIDGKRTQVGCMVGVPESEHGSARASGAMVRYGHYPTAWTIDPSDLQVAPEALREAVLELLDENALDIWNRARDARDDDD